LTPAAFRFRFQRILDVKEKQERALEIELARLDRLILDQEALQREWEGARQQTLQEMLQARRRSDLAENARCTAYLPYVRARIAQCARAAAELRSQRESVRQKLEQVMKSRKMLEKYRDRLLAEFLVALEKADERVTEVHSARKFIEAEGRL
jgi:flagellar export protein FliJ